MIDVESAFGFDPTRYPTRLGLATGLGVRLDSNEPPL